MFDSFYLEAVFVGFLATYLGRVLPFLLFKYKQNSNTLGFIQKNMPLVIMVILVFYCLFSFELDFVLFFSCALVLVLEICFKNALLSIILGTIFYMIASRFM